MDAIQIEATPREAGKKSARAARRNREVPCVLYGGGIDKPVLFQVPELTLRPLIYTPDTHTAAISVGGQTFEAILKSVVMHPVTDRPFHADFIALRAGEKIRVNVALRYVGQAPAIRAGLVLNELVHELEVECLPKDIPGHIDVDISKLEGVHDALHLSDVELPQGVTTNVAPETLLLAVVPPMREEAPVEGAESPATESAEQHTSGDQG